MVKVSVFYPNTPGHKFDMSYYMTKHLNLVKQKLAPALKGVQAEVGLGGPEPGSPATYVVMFHMLFDSLDAFQKAFGPAADAIVGDIKNYTDLQPVVQISEVKL